MTELTFLIDLMLNHKLPPATKKMVAERIGAVESSLSSRTVQFTPGTIATHSRAAPTAQSPSTQRILDEMAMNPVEVPPVVGQTPAAAQALAMRQEAIRIATSGKEERGRTSPRKF